MALDIKSIDPLPHHEQAKVCATRPVYRQGRKETAVKVYTINQESCFLLIIGVPAVGAKDELHALCSKYGDLTVLEPVDDYPCEAFTEVHLACYSKLQSARYAKRKLDGYSFFGGVLHICYAPECETLEQTRSKLIDRQKYINIVTKSGFDTPWSCRKFRKGGAGANRALNIQSGASTTLESCHTETSESVAPSNVAQTTYIWAGKTYTVDQSDALQAEAGSSDTGNHPDANRLSDAQPDNPLHFIPRQLLSSKRKDESESHGPTYTYEETTSVIRSKLSKVNEPHLEIKFKKKKSH